MTVYDKEEWVSTEGMGDGQAGWAVISDEPKRSKREMKIARRQRGSEYKLRAGSSQLVSLKEKSKQSENRLSVHNV